MAEQPGREHRNGHEGVVASGSEHRAVGKRQLRDVELLVAEHPVERLARPRYDRVEIDPARFDRSVDQRTHAVVVPERYRQADIGHGAEYYARVLAPGEIEIAISFLSRELPQGRLGIGGSAIRDAKPLTPPARP